MTTFKIGQSVRITTMARTDAVGKIIRAPEQSGGYTVRLPNWQADGVHLDVFARPYELATGAGRAKKCTCCYCGGR